MKKLFTLAVMALLAMPNMAQITGIADTGYSLMDANWTMLGFFPNAAEDAETQTSTRYYCQTTAPNTGATVYKTWKLGNATLTSKNVATSNTVNYLTAGAKILDPVSSTGDYSTAAIGLMKMVLHYNTEGNPDMKEISPATIFPVNITAAGASTLMLPVEVTIPKNVKAYTLTYNDEALVATPVENTIPARTPVLLNAAEGTYGFEVVESADPVFTSDDVLTSNNHKYVADANVGDMYGAFQPHFVPQNAYVLQNGDSGVGFYQVDVANYAINAFRCYVSVPAAPSNLRIVFPEDGVTGISTVATAADNVVYNLQGQRVEATKAGVYVKNGKKFIVK